MNSILAATLVVRVFGLATITDQVPNDCGTHVIVPRVEHGSHAGKQTLRVEDHTAMLVVHNDYYDTDSSWKMIPMPAFPHYRYVVLNGDEVRVLTDAVNAAPILSTLQLPSLKGCCPAKAAVKGLRSSYQAPYTGAAAVMDVPGGTINACTAKMTGNEWRYDTEITMKHNGSVKISGDTMKERKEIRLKGLPTTKGSAGVVYLANLPACFITNSCTPKLAKDADSLAHVHAYYQMLDGVTSACTSTMKTCKLPQTRPAECKTPMLHNAAGIGGMQAFTFECSNTKFP